MAAPPTIPRRPQYQPRIRKVDPQGGRHAVVQYQAPISQTLQLQVFLMLDGKNWTDVSADVLLEHLSFKYGMPDGQPLSLVAYTGEFKFTLNNSATNSAKTVGYYSPNNANVRSGFTLFIPVLITFSYLGVRYAKFRGRLADIEPVPGLARERVTACTATDYMDELGRAKLTGIGAATSTTADAALSTLIGAMPTDPASMQFDTGVASFPYALVGGSQGVINALQECQRLATSEFGYIYVKGDQGYGGVLTFENRHHRLFIRTSASTLSDSTLVPTLTVPTTLDNLINNVQTTVHPRRVDASPVVLYSSLTASSTSPTLIQPNATITINGPYRDPSQTVTAGLSLVAGTSMITPVASTDYTANSAANGGGTDLTANLTVTTVFGSTGATFTITNTGATPAYLTLLQCRGIGLYDYDQSVSISEDLTSEATYGVHSLSFDMPYEADPLNGKAAADAVRVAWANPFGFATVVTFVANTSSSLLTAALAREIGDRVTVTETVTGVSNDFFINAIECQVTGGSSVPILTCIWTLNPANTANTPLWLLGVTMQSELGTDTYLSGF